MGKKSDAEKWSPTCDSASGGCSLNRVPLWVLVLLQVDYVLLSEEKVQMFDDKEQA